MTEALVEQTTSEVLPYDDALLQKVKGKPKKPVQPDETEKKLKVSKLQELIQQQIDRISEISDTIKRNSGKDVSPGTREILRRLQSHKNEFHEVLRRKIAVREELMNVSKQREDLKVEMRQIYDKTKDIRSLDTLETKIQEFTFQLNHEYLEKKKEEELIMKLKQHEDARPLAQRMTALQAKLQHLEEQRSTISARLAECDGILNQIKATEDQDRAELDAIKSKEQVQVVDIPSLTHEKNECYDIIKALRGKIDEIKSDYDTKYKEYRVADKNYNAYLKYERLKRNEERAKERQEREVQKSSEHVPEVVSQPYEAEVFLCDQTITYIKKKLGIEEVGSKQEDKQVQAPSGMVLFKRKDDDESLFGGLSKKKDKKNTQEKATVEKKSQKLNHSLETLKIFMALEVEVPQTTADLPSTLEKVEVKKASLLQLREQVLLKQAAPQEPSVTALSLDEEEVEDETVEEAETVEEVDAMPEMTEDADVKEEDQSLVEDGITQAEEVIAPPEKEVAAGSGETGSEELLPDVDEISTCIQDTHGNSEVVDVPYVANGHADDAADEEADDDEAQDLSTTHATSSDLLVTEKCQGAAVEVSLMVDSISNAISLNLNI